MGQRREWIEADVAPELDPDHATDGIDAFQTPFSCPTEPRIRQSKGGTQRPTRLNLFLDAADPRCPGRQAILRLRTTWLAALHCTRSLASAGRMMVLHSCSSACWSSAAQRTAACYSVSIDVSAQRLLERRLPGHGALHRQHLLTGARTESDAVGTRCGLKRPEAA